MSIAPPLLGDTASLVAEEFSLGASNGTVPLIRSITAVHITVAPPSLEHAAAGAARPMASLAHRNHRRAVLLVLVVPAVVVAVAEPRRENARRRPVAAHHLHTARNIASHLRLRPRLRNDLYCVGWGVKLYSLTHYDFDI